MTERQGVEIDYCPKCRGVWLDRGELDKIIERSDQLMQNKSQRGVNRDEQDDEQNEGYGKQGSKKRRGGFLSDLMDFGD